MSGFRLAVCAEMVFRDLPIEQRVRRIADLGFEVEIWDWTKKDIDVLARTGATISSMTGYVRGTLADPAGADELLRTAEQSLRVAEQLDCPRLNVHGTGLDDQGLPVVASQVVTPAMWLHAARTLTRLAELGERAGRVFTLENLNTAVDHPGTPFARAADTLALVAAVDNPHLRMNLDLYHAQIGSPTSPAAANREPGKSTIRRSPPPSPGAGIPESSVWRPGPRVAPFKHSNGSEPRSPATTSRPDRPTRMRAAGPCQARPVRAQTSHRPVASLPSTAETAQTADARRPAGR